MRAEIQNFLKDFVSPSTKSTYSYVLNSFANSVNDKPLIKITPSEVEHYINRIIKEHGVVSNTTKVHQTVLKAFFKKHNRLDLIETLKKFKIQTPEQQIISPEMIITKEEYEKLLKATECIRDEIILCMFWETGARLSEIVDIKTNNILKIEIENEETGEMETRHIIVVSGKGRKGKGKKSRQIPFTEKTFTKIQDYIKDQNPKGTIIGIKKNGVSKLLLKLCAKAKIRALHIHLFRHTFCTRMANKDVSIFKLKAMTGHESTKTLERYYHATPEILIKEFDRVTGKTKEAFEK